jgi:hypothetical protein
MKFEEPAIPIAADPAATLLRAEMRQLYSSRPVDMLAGIEHIGCTAVPGLEPTQASG